MRILKPAHAIQDKPKQKLRTYLWQGPSSPVSHARGSNLDSHCYLHSIHQVQTCSSCTPKCCAQECCALSAKLCLLQAWKCPAQTLQDESLLRPQLKAAQTLQGESLL